MGMNLFINTEKSPAAVQAKATGSLVSSLRLKRGANLNLSVIIMGSTTASNLRFGIKAKGDYEGSLLAYAESATGQLSDEGMKFDLSLAVTSVALNEAFNVGSGNAITAASISAVAEFAWQEDGAERLSDTINTTLLNDIIRLATEAPEAAAGEYPAPDLVATKSWVNQLKASAAQAGLVLLEADAIIEGEHTAVALTAAGTIAIPLATASESGTVILGTDTPISGRNILPVGKDTSGKLAVSADGLSAFDSAKKMGFVGTEEEWVASLKGEQGAPGEPGPQGEQGIQGEQGEPGIVDEELISTILSNTIYRPEGIEFTTAEGTTSINCRWAQISLVHCPPAGKLKKVTIPCRKTASTEMTTSASYIGIFEEQDNGTFIHVGTSTNTVVQTLGTDSVWLFDNLKLNGRKLRICLMASSTTTELNTSLILSGLGVYNDSDGCYLTNSSGSTEKYLLCATFDLDSPGPLFVPIDHVDDITSHLSESEHTGLSELLANKDALLALLNS